MFQLFIVAVVSILVLAACLFFHWAWLKPRKIEKFLRKQGLEGNPYRLLFGDSKETIRMYEEADSKPIGIHDDIVPRIFPNFSHYVRKYGNFCFTWAGPRPRILIMDPSVARYVLSKHLVFLKPFPTSNYTVKKLMSGLVGMEGEEWSKARTRDNAAFKHEKLKPMVPMIEQCCEETINDIKIAVSKAAGTGLVDVALHMKKLISSVFARAMFNSPFNDRIEETFKNVEELSRLAEVHAQIFSIPGEKYLPTKRNRQGNALEKAIKESLTSIIEERLRNPEAGKDSNKDLLDIFMMDLSQGKFSNNKERNMIIDDIIGQIKVYFFGSSEPATNLLAWSLILLSHNQDCQNRAREEVLQVLGRKDHFTHEVVAKLKYINMVVQETLRLYNPIIEITRLVAEDATVGKYQIPKDSLLTFPLLMYNRSPEYWGEDAQEFKPERFAKGVGSAYRCNGENPFIPFGWGPRICIGMNFALIEAKIALATLLREFSFEPSPTYTHAPCAAFSMHPQFGASLVVKQL